MDQANSKGGKMKKDELIKKLELLFVVIKPDTHPGATKKAVLDLARQLEEVTGFSQTEIESAKKALINICQLLDGWHQDGTVWTEFDEQCRKDARELLKKFYGLRAEIEEG